MAPADSEAAGFREVGQERRTRGHGAGPAVAAGDRAHANSATAPSITAAPNVSSLPACMESQNGDAAEGSVARPESISRSSPRRRAEAAV